ncbi:MAG: NAD-dependent epimerase/dehydratase family protein [Alphaproteobacteria bacterium]|jgi:UDP-glucuronate 4-epimerase|nr:NAD-dependent epimerase/dehydratase family protein [Alphaproteobacteria bacterium]
MSSAILVTGAAGFIGFHTSLALLKKGQTVVGIDNVNPYYDVKLKENRLKILQEYPNFHFHKIDISDRDAMEKVWKAHAPILQVVHLAAQAGVRYSLVDPFPYITSNIMGFMVILELCRYQPGFQHLVYASTSSVYGTNKDMPFSESQRTDSPMSLYAATKRSNELMAQSYHYLYNLPVTGLRFFTVYGPWGRPDMSAFKFMKAMMAGEPIDVYNNGKMARDYTYIDDIVDGIIGALGHTPSVANDQMHPVYNIGNNKSESLMDFIGLLEKSMDMTAVKNFMPLQDGDVPATAANISAAQNDFGYAPTTPIAVGIPRLVAWYKEYNGLE